MSEGFEYSLLKFVTLANKSFRYDESLRWSNT